MVDKLINKIYKEENKIIIDDIENNRTKFSKEYKFDKGVIKHSGDLDDAVKIILEINKVLISGKVNKEVLKSNKVNNEVLKSDKVNIDLMKLYNV